MTINLETVLNNLPGCVIAVDENLLMFYSNQESGCRQKVVEPSLKYAIERAFNEKSGFDGIEVSAKRDACAESIFPEYGYASGRYVETEAGRFVVVVVFDITPLHRHTEKIEKALDKAENASALKSSCLQNISHELRSPLNAIIGFSRLLTETSDKSRQSKYAGIIDTNSQLILRLADDVLDMAKADSGNMQYEYRKMDVNAFIKSMADMAEMKTSPDTIVNCMFGRSELTLTTAPERLSQVMMNLLNNAVKYTASGNITVGYDVHGDEVRFYVKDTGTGIAPEKQKHVFKRFWRDRNDDFGAGLGLPICKDIIEHLGGHIGLKSAGEGQGCTFWFTVPTHTPYVETADTTETEEAGTSEDLCDEEPQERPTLLIAEDNEGNYMLYEALFGEDFKIIHAWNGQEAVELASKYDPDLILMDISMPGMDGHEATRLIRESGSRIPIIAVTAYAFSSDKEQIMDEGFNAYISKPINEEELLAAMEKCLEPGE